MDEEVLRLIKESLEAQHKRNQITDKQYENLREQINNIEKRVDLIAKHLGLI